MITILLLQFFFFFFNIGIATTTTICKSDCSMSVGHAGHSINREV